jgi:hypothetical protein
MTTGRVLNSTGAKKRDLAKMHAVEMPGYGKYGAGFPPFPHPLEILRGFPHYHGYGDD